MMVASFFWAGRLRQLNYNWETFSVNFCRKNGIILLLLSAEDRKLLDN